MDTGCPDAHGILTPLYIHLCWGKQSGHQNHNHAEITVFGLSYRTFVFGASYFTHLFLECRPR